MTASESRLYICLFLHDYAQLFSLLLRTDVRDLLRTWRENSERQSKDVVDIWENKLMFKVDNLGNESANQLKYYFYIKKLHQYFIYFLLAIKYFIFSRFRISNTGTSVCSSTGLLLFIIGRVLHQNFNACIPWQFACSQVSCNAFRSIRNVILFLTFGDITCFQICIYM